MADVKFFSTDPGELANQQAQAAVLTQQQALAQMLMQQGMTPLSTQDRQVGGVGYRVSPLEGLAKLLQVYAVEKTLIEARRKGYSVSEQPLHDGSIQLQILTHA